MGRNTTILILNDSFDVIDKDPVGWWQATKEVALNTFLRKELTGRTGNVLGSAGVEYGFGGHANGFRVVCEDHADYTNVIAVGGNHATSLLRIHNGGRHHEEVDQVLLLRIAAAELGYDLEPRMTVKLHDRLRRAYELACERLVALGEHPPTVDD